MTENNQFRWYQPFFQVPMEALELSGSAMHVLIVLYAKVRNVWYCPRWPKRFDGCNDMPIDVRVRIQTISSQTGLSERTVKTAIRELVAARAIEVVKNYGRGKGTAKGFGRNFQRRANSYCLTPPKRSNRMAVLESIEGHAVNEHRETLLKHRVCATDGSWKRTGRSTPLQGYDYFTLPVHVLAILSAMTNSQKKLYVTLLSELRERKDAIVRKPVKDLRAIAQLTGSTFQKTRLELVAQGFIADSDDGFVIHDPETRLPFSQSQEDDFRKYRHEGKPFPYLEMFHNNPEEYLAKLGITFGSRSGDHLNFCCPFHGDNAPSARIDCERDGAPWYCYSCQKGGNLFTLMKAAMKTESARETFVETAKLFGLNLAYSETGRFFDYCMANCKGYYDYFYADGAPAFRKFRMEKDGEKKFFPFRWNAARQEFVDNRKFAAALPSLLYRWPVPHTEVVLLSEGEKDCERLEKVYDMRDGRMIATTTGSSNSWKDALADHFVGMHVYILSDKDEAGALYEAAVIASLMKRNISYSVVGYEFGLANGADCKDVSDYLDAEGVTPLHLSITIATAPVVPATPHQAVWPVSELWQEHAIFESMACKK